VIRVQFDELSTSKGWVTPAQTGRTINLFGHAGALLFYASVLSYLLLHRKGYYRPGALGRIAQSTVRRAVRSSIGIATMVGMAVVMQHAGMTRMLAAEVADAVGGAFPLASPFIGALGAFITGSNTNSNVVLGSFQQDAAMLLGLNVPVILAAQTAGAAIGSVFAPSKVIVGASTIGLGGQEGPVLKKVMTYGLALVGVISLATWLAIMFVE
jgi:lactate permease